MEKKKKKAEEDSCKHISWQANEKVIDKYF